MSDPILSVRDLSVVFDVNAQNAWPWTPPRKLHAVSKLSLDLQPGETLGLVGESGSGKSTLVRAIIGTVPVISGDILYKGQSLTQMGRKERRNIAATCRWCFKTRSHR